MAKSRYNLILADLHYFSAYGRLPSGYVNSSGNAIGQNIGQEYLERCHEHMLEHLPKRLDGLFILGEICDGLNLKGLGRGILENELTFQAAASSAALQEIVDRVKRNDEGVRQIYVVEGSHYHIGAQGELDETVARNIGAMPKSGRYCPPWRHVMCGPVLYDVAHHQSFTIRYRSMPLEREAEFMMADRYRRCIEKPKMTVIMRAHNHVGLREWWEDAETLCISIPAFKLMDLHAQHSKTPNRWVPSRLGAVGMKVYEEKQPGGYVEIDRRFLYEHPQDEVEVME